MFNIISFFFLCLLVLYVGSYKYMMRGATSFSNVFMAGDWIINRHGSWSQVSFQFLLIWVKIINQMKIFYDKCHWQEKSYVTGLEAANRVVDYLEEGSFAKIIPVEEDEPHIEALRNLNRRFNEFRDQIPLSNFFLQWTFNWVICYFLSACTFFFFHNVYRDATTCSFWLALVKAYQLIHWKLVTNVPRKSNKNLYTSE